MEHYTNSCDGCTNAVRYDYLSLDISGGYNLFNDHAQPVMLTLCHRCVLRMIKLFPAMEQLLGKGCHPCGTEKPCCAFAWQKIDGVNMVPSKDLQSWVPFVN